MTKYHNQDQGPHYMVKINDRIEKRIQTPNVIDQSI